MINMEENLLKAEEANKIKAILEEEVLLILLSTWKMLMIYLKNSLEVEILLLDFLMMMMIFLEEVLAIQVLVWWEIWGNKKTVVDNSKKKEMILSLNSEWVSMMTISSVEVSVEVWWVAVNSQHSLQIVLAVWEVVWGNLLVNKL